MNCVVDDDGARLASSTTNLTAARSTVFEPSVRPEGQRRACRSSLADYESRPGLDCVLYQRRGSFETGAGVDEGSTVTIDQCVQPSTDHSRPSLQGHVHARTAKGWCQTKKSYRC